MGYPPTDYLGYTIKTKDRKVFKLKRMGIIFDSHEDATSWIKFHCDEFDKNVSMSPVLSPDERVALEDCEVIACQGNL